MRYILVSLMTILGACTVHSVSPESAAFIPANREIYAYCSIKNLRDANANLIVVRDEVFWGSETPHIILFNGEECAELMPGEKLSLYLPTGSYTIGAINKWAGYNASSTFRIADTNVTISVHKITVIHEGMDSGGLQYITQD